MADSGWFAWKMWLRHALSRVPRAEILRTLECFGLMWRGPVLYQSTRTEAYRYSLEKLRREGFAYPCSCSRREIGDGIYPGTCRKHPLDSNKSEPPVGEEILPWAIAHWEIENAELLVRLTSADYEMDNESCSGRY